MWYVSTLSCPQALCSPIGEDTLLWKGNNIFNSTLEMHIAMTRIRWGGVKPFYFALSRVQVWDVASCSSGQKALHRARSSSLGVFRHDTAVCIRAPVFCVARGKIAITPYYLDNYFFGNTMWPLLPVPCNPLCLVGSPLLLYRRHYVDLRSTVIL